MDFENLTEEQRQKARACRTTEEILALAKEEGMELTDEQLEGVAGGWGGGGEDNCSDDCTRDF